MYVQPKLQDSYCLLSCYIIMFVPLVVTKSCCLVSLLFKAALLCSLNVCLKIFLMKSFQSPALRNKCAKSALCASQMHLYTESQNKSLMKPRILFGCWKLIYNKGGLLSLMGLLQSVTD